MVLLAFRFFSFEPFIQVPRRADVRDARDAHPSFGPVEVCVAVRDAFGS